MYTRLSPKSPKNKLNIDALTIIFRGVIAIVVITTRALSRCCSFLSLSLSLRGENKILEAARNAQGRRVASAREGERAL